VRKLLAAGLAFGALAMAVPVASAQPEGPTRADDAGARQFLGELALTPPALYPERLPRPFRDSAVFTEESRHVDHETVDYLVQWVSGGMGRGASELGLVRVGCAAIGRSLRALEPGEFRRRRTTVRHTDGTWIVDDDATGLFWCEGEVGYGASFNGATDDWRLERRKVRTLVRALAPV
jgi:hypothetical protein